MPKLQAISKNTHATLRWKRYGSYVFASQDTVAPLVMHELPKAAMALPIAFVAQGEQFTLVAVQGVQPGRNLFVAPDGRWVGGYTPAAYRSYPFVLAAAENDQLVLCVDADSGLVGAFAPAEGEAFFDAADQPSQAVKEVLGFLQQVHASGQVTRRLCTALAAEGLIQPWPIQLQGADGGQTVQGLYRIDEARLNGLGSEALYRLHQGGALPLAYAQLLSMQHLPRLGQLAQAHAQAEAAQKATSLPTSANGEIDLEFLKQGGTLRFGGL